MIATDARMAAQLEVLRIILGTYLDHLSRCWHHHGDSSGSVSAILASVGQPITVATDRRRDVDKLRRSIQSTRTGPLARLVAGLDLTEGEELLVAAAWWTEIDAQLGSVFGVLHDDGHKRYPTSGLLHLVGRAFDIAVPVHPRRLLELLVISSEGPRSGISLTPAARELLDGVYAAPHEGATDIELETRLERLVDPVVALLESSDGSVALCGTRGSGRRRLAHVAASRLNRTVMEVDTTTGDIQLLARLGAVLPVVSAPVDGSTVSWPAGCGPLIVLADPEVAPATACSVEVPLPTPATRAELWRRSANQLGVDASELVHTLADRFRFTEAEIVEAADRAHLRAQIEDRDVEARDLWRAAQRQPGLDLGRIASRIEPAFTFEDLVLTDRVRQQLDEIVAHVRHHITVFERWGFRDRMPRGEGVAVLFCGPPGTGKTTAAEAIANELSTELFRIDLSQVVSKYIGETEKNLAVAFREAERSGAILLFDEADALFGRRTDVRDAHDRYANLEVSYLLQRVETFTGLVILSTNKIGNIDEAFQRRLRFVVRFEPPTPAERLRLWQRSFAPRARLGPLDWDELATHELTGGHIQTAALSAAFLAAADGGVILDEHVVRALTAEYEKLNRAAPIAGGR